LPATVTLTVSVPETDEELVQFAEHEVAFVDDQVRVTEEPTNTDEDDELSDTLTGRGAEPPPPPPPQEYIKKVRDNIQKYRIVSI
tara:strand:+ start:12345 stop:12599 length:255 start_codon:yes stop_codon:yes gene_type:complete